MSTYSLAQVAKTFPSIEAFKSLVVVLSSSTLFIMFDNIKQSFLDKLQAKKALVKKKTREILLLSPSTKDIYNIAIAKKINDCLNNIIGMQITKVAKKNAR